MPQSDTGLQSIALCSFLTRCWQSRCWSCCCSWSMSGRTGLAAVKLGTVLLVPTSSTLTHRPACPRITGEPESCGNECTDGDPLWAVKQPTQTTVGPNIYTRQEITPSHNDYKAMTVFVFHKYVLRNCTNKGIFQGISLRGLCHGHKIAKYGRLGHSDSDSVYWTCSQKAKNQKAKQTIMHCTTKQYDTRQEMKCNAMRWKKMNEG